MICRDCLATVDGPFRQPHGSDCAVEAARAADEERWLALVVEAMSNAD